MISSIKRRAKDACLYMHWVETRLHQLCILFSLEICDRWADSFQIWQMYAVALGNFLEYAALKFQIIREVT